MTSVVTHPRVYAPPSTSASALRFIDDLHAMPGFRAAGDSVQTWRRLRSLLGDGKISGPLTYDARIAAVCIDHAVSELWSTDRNFSRFPQIKVVNPLIKRGSGSQ